MGITSKTKMKIYPLLKDACAKHHISTEKMLDYVRDTTNTPRGTVMKMFRGWEPLTKSTLRAFSEYTNLSEDEILKASKEEDKQHNMAIPDYVVWHLNTLSNVGVSTELVESYDTLLDFKNAVEQATGYRVVVKKFKVNKMEKAPPSATMYHSHEYEVHYIIEKKVR